MFHRLYDRSNLVAAALAVAAAIAAAPGEYGGSPRRLVPRRRLDRGPFVTIARTETNAAARRRRQIERGQLTRSNGLFIYTAA